ncbi:hypothetical protein D1B31_00045 [Neobacillus notoginsengisoli]|uniref:PucR C-terminal helix-turn-helix domain-containing protein n=1 Tax=Neobacillus notoginsengisoli TaxID=1578198 RepID=A0A417YZK0_9BACI|nr:helix-turn-helix domain-containing protein [Neobacillus notoginsengisoli]RHW43108.1 hypothetical protein D1B31_00045 [Neobacillus notoginsengisoli]
MFTNLMKLYPGAWISDYPPALDDNKYYLFQNETSTEWIAIPVGAISEREVDLLTSLFKRIEEPAENLSPLLEQWRDYLFHEGALPLGTEDSAVRIIQVQFYGDNYEREELEAAIKGFFPDDVLVVWEGPSRAITIEHDKITLDENDLASMADVFENDFFLKTAAYIGRQLPVTAGFPDYFQEERRHFDFAKRAIGPIGFYSFEKVFPAYVASELPELLADALNREFAEAFRSDDEMYLTVKGFLENGSNASLAAKKLYIHRNTLQYRIDKFTDRTGVSLKDFHSAFTVYLACLLYERDRKRE